MGLTELTHNTGNLLENPCTIHILEIWRNKRTYNLKEVWVITQDLRWIFPCYEKWMGKPMHFWRDVEYHKAGIWWKKSSLLLKKVWVSVSQGGFCCIFLCYGKLTAEVIYFPRNKVYHRILILGKDFGKVWVPISEALPDQWVSLHFPMLW